MSKLTIATVAILAGCATKPAMKSDQYNLEAQANQTLRQMRSVDPRIDDVVHDAYAYAVFPDVGKAGVAAAGGAFGRGILYEQGQAVGFVKIEQASVGPQLGGQTYAELLVLQDRRQLDLLERGEFDLGANASAVILKSGAAAATPTVRGARVIVLPHGGAMAEAAVAGQRIKFEPAG